MASRIFSLVLFSILGFARLAVSLPTISVTGAKFFNSHGEQFFIKGIAYQLSPEDPLVNTTQCQLDASLMKELGANAIRVYHVDPDQKHDGCMTAFANAGIYLFLDLDTFSTMIIGPQPAFNQSQFAAFAKVLDNFQQYDNLAGVFIGNEVLTTPADSPAAPYVKIAAAEIKAYRDRQKYRKIPVGYSAADIASLRPMLQNYLVCGDHQDETIDFYGLNAYEWCSNDVTFQTSGYVALQDMSAQYPRPIFFSETGCNTARPRTWKDQEAIFGTNMSQTWSGAIAYEWIEEENDYGLVQYGQGSPGNFPRQGKPTPISPDFPNLMSAWARVSPSSILLKDYSAHMDGIKTPRCPDFTAGAWEVKPDVPLPTGPQSYAPGSVPTDVATSLSSLPTSLLGSKPTERDGSPASSQGPAQSPSASQAGQALPSATKISAAFRQATGPWTRIDAFTLLVVLAILIVGFSGTLLVF